MSDPAEINDRLEAAAIKAEGASEIMRQVANGQENAYVASESGPIPTLLEWQRLNEEALGGVPALQTQVNDIEDNLDALADSLVGAVVVVASIADLLTVPVNASRGYKVASYQPGAFALANPYNNSGGGLFLWDAARAKTAHDGGTIIDPGRTFPTDWDNDTQVTNWFTPAVSGTGCFVRLGNASIDVSMFGARYSLATPIKNTKSFQQALLSVGPAHFLEPNGKRTVNFGPGKHLITDTLSMNAFQTLQGSGHDCVLVFDHALKAIKIGDGVTTGGTKAASPKLRNFCIQKKGASEPQYPTRIVSIEGNSVNVKIEGVFFDAVYATESMVTNQSGYGLTIDHCEIRYCRSNTAHINLLNLVDESNYSYAIKILNTDITGVNKIDGTPWVAVKQAGGQLAIKTTIIQDTGTAIESGDGTQIFPVLNLDYVFLEANRDFHIKCNGTGNNRSLINITSCRLNYGLGNNISLSGAEVYIATTQDVGVSNFTGDATSEFTKARVTLGPGNGGISPADFSVSKGIILRMAPAQLVDLAGGAGTPFEIFGIDINNGRHTIIEMTHISGTGNATTSETFMIRHGASGGNFSAVSMARSVGAGGSSGTWTFSANADGRLFCSFSTAGTWRYTVVATG